MLSASLQSSQPLLSATAAARSRSPAPTSPPRLRSRLETISNSADLRHAPSPPPLTLSKTHTDDEYEYRHVILPKALVKYLPADRLAEEDEWRGLGIRQSPGWEHFLRHGASSS